MPTDMAKECWMTVVEVADYLRISRAKIYAMAQSGKIPCTNLAGRWRFSRNEIDAWMQEMRRNPPKKATQNKETFIKGDPMKMMTTKELQWLIGQQQPPCVSIYLPTHRHHPGTEQDRIRFKNLLSQTANLMNERYRDQEVGQFLAPIEALSTNEFWQYQETGLAVFCSRDMCVHYKLPITVSELVVVSNTFHTKPLLSYLNSNKHYFVLSLSQKDIRLYEGTPHTLCPINSKMLGETLCTLFDDVNQKRLLSAEDNNKDKDNKKELTKYFRSIDRALWPALRDEHSPLVLASVGYLQPLFREACRYPYILDEGIEGNMENVSLEGLRESAWRLVASYEVNIEGELLGEFARSLKVGRASHDLADIAKAVTHGRIRVLLHKAGKTLWGHLNPETGDVDIHDHQAQKNTEDADIIDDLCELTLLKGGEVFEIAANDSLNGSPIGAIYRY